MKTWVRLEEVGLLALWVYLFAQLSVSPWWMSFMLIGPDIGMLGYVINANVGALSYNLIHHRAAAVGLYFLGVLLGAEVPQAIALIVLGHSSLDRVFGYGLKYADSFQHTHLGWIGKAREGKAESQTP